MNNVIIILHFVIFQPVFGKLKNLKFNNGNNTSKDLFTSLTIIYIWGADFIKKKILIFFSFDCTRFALAACYSEQICLCYISVRISFLFNFLLSAPFQLTCTNSTKILKNTIKFE